MTNLELQQILSQLPPNLEVVAFKSGNTTLRKIKKVYVGNIKYLPNGKNRIDTDKIVLDYT